MYNSPVAVTIANFELSLLKSIATTWSFWILPLNKKFLVIISYTFKYPFLEAYAKNLESWLKVRHVIG